MRSERRHEDAWWAGVVIAGVFGLLLLCCLPPPPSHFVILRGQKSILLGCPPRLVQQKGAKGTPVSDFFSSSSFGIGSGDVGSSVSDDHLPLVRFDKRVFILKGS